MLILQTGRDILRRYLPRKITHTRTVQIRVSGFLFRFLENELRFYLNSSGLSLLYTAYVITFKIFSAFKCGP